MTAAEPVAASSHGCLMGAFTQWHLWLGVEKCFSVQCLGYNTHILYLEVHGQKEPPALSPPLSFSCAELCPFVPQSSFSFNPLPRSSCSEALENSSSLSTAQLNSGCGSGYRNCSAVALVSVQRLCPARCLFTCPFL